MAALASYLDARQKHGQWLVRMEDLDTPRIRPGAADKILKALDRLGMHWDGQIVYQSQRIEAYDEAYSSLSKMRLLYRCNCSRKMLREAVYPGTCRNRAVPKSVRHAMRIITHDEPLEFPDRLQGGYGQSLQSEVGDFIILRADGFYAYHLATVVDDAWQEITHIVRGADLLESTPRQIYLQQLLSLGTPEYLHIPVAVDRAGTKISKSTGNLEVMVHDTPATVLIRTLQLLGQDTDDYSPAEPVAEILSQAVVNWRTKSIPAQKQITVG